MSVGRTAGGRQADGGQGTDGGLVKKQVLRSRHVKW